MDEEPVIKERAMPVTFHRRLDWEITKDGFWQAQAGPFTLRLHKASRTLLVTLTDRPVVGDAGDDPGDLLALAEDAARNVLIDAETAIADAGHGITCACVPRYDR